MDRGIDGRTEAAAEEEKRAIQEKSCVKIQTDALPRPRTNRFSVVYAWSWMAAEGSVQDTPPYHQVELSFRQRLAESSHGEVKLLAIFMVFGSGNPGRIGGIASTRWIYPWSTSA